MFIFDKTQQRLVEFRSDPSMSAEVVQDLLDQKLQFTCQHYDKNSLVIPDQANMGIFKMEDTSANWPQEQVDVHAKVATMIKREN